MDFLLLHNLTMHPLEEIILHWIKYKGVYLLVLVLHFGRKKIDLESSCPDIKM